MIGWVLVLSLLASPTASFAQGYDSRKAGHPLRIVAYAAHPVGVILDYLIFRPSWWMGRQEPLRTLFGVRAMPLDDSSVSERQAPPGSDSQDLRDLPGPRPQTP